MFKDNKNLIVIAIIAIVNALGYGIIIPIMYSYAKSFGLSDFQNGLIFATFSVCQFLSTPIIGRLSDKYGRKPLLLVSLGGTVVSFLMMAFAPNAIFLFLARALDGITAGNIPVATAVISDTLEPKDRAKGFGLIGASFGFGFIFGPAISALTVGFGTHIPFLIAASISAVAVLLTAIILPETNKHVGEVSHSKLFDWAKLFGSLFDPAIGKTLLISLIYSFAYGMFIYAYQPFSVRILNLNASQISLNFTIFGIVGLISQAVIIPKVLKMFGEKKMLLYSLGTLVFTFLAIFFTRDLIIFTIISIVQSLANGFVNPVLQSILSQEADEKSQGSIQGLNASYASVGMIFGPIVGGIVATVMIPLPFVAGSISMLVCFGIAIVILKQHLSKAHLFVQEN